MKNKRTGRGSDSISGADSAGWRSAPSSADEIIPGRDYTAEIEDFLRSAHGKIRLDGNGDYFYENVSTISLHFLLKSDLPSKEILWRWYNHFEGVKSESIYQTLPPQRDEEFLEILEGCSFRWNADAIRQSGLVFLSEHRKEVYLGLEEIFCMRLDVYETMEDEELAHLLRPRDTWSDVHLRKLIKKIQTQPLTSAQRNSIYDQLESDYLKATARHLMDETHQEKFWKSPPPELESLHSRFIIFSRTMTNTARRLGVYLSRKMFEEEMRGAPGDSSGDWSENMDNGAGKSWGTGKKSKIHHNNRHLETGYFEALDLDTSASLSQVKSAYREKVKYHHPDQGGSIQDFLRLQEAYEYLLTQVF